MSTFSHFPLQKALFQLLTGDSALMNMVNGIYDRPPQGTEFPYITLGDLSGSDWSTKTTAGMEYTAVLYTWSREGGRKEASDIMERLHALLHDADVAAEGHEVVMMRFLSSTIALESDGWTYRGSMRFRALLEAVA